MQHGIQSFLDWVMQNFGGNVQFIRASVLALPDFCCGTVSVCSRLALYGNNRNGQFSGKEVRIKVIIDVLQLTDSPTHFGGFFHGIASPIM